MDMYFGAAYYPEYLTREKIIRDAKLMQEAGMNLVRMGEFAWIYMEPNNNEFDFYWLNQAVEILGSYGIQSLLCTPTAAPPKWLTDQHPDILQIMDDGRVRPFGRRRHYCINNKTYHKYSKRIVEKLALYFKDNANVVGYQLDNEFMAEEPYCYSSTCLEEFQNWLRIKYNDINALNEQWGTGFWSQCYRSFEEVHLPRKGDSPSVLLEYYNFASDSFLNYAKLQFDTIKAVDPSILVTHNICSSGYLVKMDLYKMGKLLDFVSLDTYPMGWSLDRELGLATQETYYPAMSAFSASLARSAKAASFWVTEAQTGWCYDDVPEPGMLRLWAFQDMAKGAVARLHFNWRTHAFGQEQLLTGILDQDSVPRRRYREIQAYVKEIKRVIGTVEAIKPVANVAIIRDFHCDWAFEASELHPEFRYLKYIYDWYKAFYEHHITCAILAPDDDLTDFDIVVCPALVMTDDKITASLKAYAQSGGTLILTCLTSYRNRNNVFHSETLPAFLRDVTGVSIEEQIGIYRKTVQLELEGAYFEVSPYAEIIKTDTAQTLGVYKNCFFKDTPAITKNRFGKGTVFYVAAQLKDSGLHKLVGRITKDKLPALPIASETDKVEITHCKTESKDLYFVLNFSDLESTVFLHAPFVNLLNGETMMNIIQMRPRDVWVLSK